MLRMTAFACSALLAAACSTGGAPPEAAAPQAAAEPAAAAPARVEPTRTTFTAGKLTVELVDYSPQFLDWYRAAQTAPDADQRFALWSERYGRASVPPTDEGKAMARKIVDAAWPRYPSAVPIAEAGAAKNVGEYARMLGKVAEVLDLSEPREIRIQAIIGAFEDNAYTFGGDKPTVVIQLETTPEIAGIMMAHESTHAVHMLMSGQTGAWERTIAETIIQEGLAMYVSREAVPGNPDPYYIGPPQWWGKAEPAREQILAGIRADLARSDSDTVTRYTMGQGNTGLMREAYAAGWWVVGQMRSDGMTLAQIAKLRSDALPGMVDAAIGKLLTP